MIRLVIMAAGQATRMGSDKLALAWENSTVLGYMLDNILSGMQRVSYEINAASELVVVARKPIQAFANADTIKKFKECGGNWKLCASPQPLAQTIRIGLEKLKNDAVGIGFIPGDQVGITINEFVKLMEFFINEESDFLVPVAEEMSGSPVFFHRKYVSELLELEGEKGGKDILKKYPHLWTTYKVSPDFFEDLDTREDYERLRERFK